MLRTIDSLGDLGGKTILLRCDLNVPLKDGEITDDGRVRASVPTIRELLEGGARVVAMSHLGRPDGAPDEKYSLRPVATRLAELLGEEVAFGQPGAARVTLLENLRFDPRETSKDDDERTRFAEPGLRRAQARAADTAEAPSRSCADQLCPVPAAAGR